MQQDQQADADDNSYGAFNFADESVNAARIDEITEVFPEPRSVRRQISPTLNMHTINFFFPWQINENGTDLETLNHIGRHELAGYFNRSFNNDGNLTEFYDPSSLFNQNRIESFHHIDEDPQHPGLYYGINCQEFSTHASGQIVKLTGQPSLAADQMAVTWVTHPDTASTSDSPSANHSGLYRDPLVLSGGGLVASHTTNTREDSNIGTSASPRSRYDFRLKVLQASGGFMVPQSNLTAGITRNLQWWNPDSQLSYSGAMWELQPVELRVRTRPTPRTTPLDSIEANVFAQAGVDVPGFQAYLRQYNLALIVSRNITSRDAADKQQPFNLRVTGTSTQTTGASGTVYDVAHLQLFQGDQLRGYGGVNDPQPGRRVVARALHEGMNLNVPNSQGPLGSVRIAADGSMAAIVPARRALSWQLTDGAGNGVVRERFWLTFQPGEIRVCASCHGVNSLDQAGRGKPTNPPQALADLLSFWRSLPPSTPPSGTPPSTPPNSPPGSGSSGGSSSGAPGEGGVGSMLSVRAVGVDSENHAQFDLLYSGRVGLFEIRGANPGEQLQLRMSIVSTTCSARKVITANEAGIARLVGRLSGASRRSVVVTLTARRDGVLRGAGQATLVNPRAKVLAGRATRRERDNICRAFSKFR